MGAERERSQPLPRLCRLICGTVASFATLARCLSQNLRFSDNLPEVFRGYAARMFRISRDNPAYYLTSVAHDRLPIFQTDAIKQIVCDFDEARRSAGMLIFAYLIMPDHTHVLTDNAREMKDVLR